MSVSCHIKVSDEGGASEAGPMASLTFEELPRVGEFVSFSRDGKRGRHGELLPDLYRVRYVIHSAATDLSPANTILDVVLERSNTEP